MLAGFLQETFRRFGGGFSFADEEVAADLTCASGLEQAIEFVVDETSSRLRAVSGYSRRLKRPITTAFQYVDEMVERVPGVFPCRRTTFGEDPHVNAFFVSHTHLQEVFSYSKEVRELFESNPGVAECYTLLCMQREERQRFGVALVGDEIRKDVMQTTVSFSDHQVVSPGMDEADARCALKCCIFRSLIGYIRSEAAKSKTRTADLENRARIARSRLARLDPQFANSGYRENLENQIEAIDRKLQSQELRFESLEDHLQFVIDVLNHPERYVYDSTQDIYVDRMGIRRETAATESTYKLSLAEIQIVDREPRIAALVCFPREELLPEKDFLREASIFLTSSRY